MSGFEVAAIITALGTLVTAGAGAWLSMRTFREVRTLNESTLGQLGAATETRRIHAKEGTGELITDKEQRHIDAAPKEGP